MFDFPQKQNAHVLGETIEYVSGGSGASTVVLVNGSGGPIEGWHKMFGQIMKFAKVFAYNRPGVGGSSEPETPQTGSHLVDSLRAVLAAADLSPPYVLVGHSLGGIIVNLFARLYPTEVAAVVLIEATAASDITVLAAHETKLQRALRLILEKIAPGNPYAEGRHVHRTVAELESTPAFPAVPLTVVTGGKPAMAWATSPQALSARAVAQKDLANLSPLGIHTIATRSGHFPQFTEPQLLISIIEEVANSSFEPNR